MAAYIRNTQTVPDDTPGGSTVRQGVADQNSIAIDNLFTNLNSHSNNEDGLTHLQIDEQLNEIQTNYIPVMDGLVESASESATTAENAEASAKTYSDSASHCAASANQDATTASEAADQAVRNVPIGVILPFIGGYFTDSSNSGFTNVIGDTAAEINALVNSEGYVYCDGPLVNTPGEPLFDGPDRYAANLTNDIFIKGSLAAGAIGGSNTSDHVHDMLHQHTGGDHQLTADENGPHTHTIRINRDDGAGAFIESSDGTGTQYSMNTGSSGLGDAHSHGMGSLSQEYTATPSDTNNMPNFFGAHFIQKVSYFPV